MSQIQIIRELHFQSKVEETNANGPNIDKELIDAELQSDDSAEIVASELKFISECQENIVKVEQE